MFGACIGYPRLHTIHVVVDGSCYEVEDEMLIWEVKN